MVIRKMKRFTLFISLSTFLMTVFGVHEVTSDALNIFNYAKTKNLLIKRSLDQGITNLFYHLMIEEWNIIRQLY